jgi:hypothetical protein
MVRCLSILWSKIGLEFGNQLLHGLSNVQAEFGNEVVDSEINGFSCAIFLSLASFMTIALWLLV